MKISYELSDNIALIRLNHPEKLKALTGAMVAELGEWFASLKREPTVRAVILTGTGERAFCAGVDIAEFASVDAEGLSEMTKRVREDVCSLIESCGVPVIAAVNGLAAGRGFELALACHIRLASTNARFSLPEVEPSVVPECDWTQRLARALGTGRAFEMMRTGKKVSADEALRTGLVNRVVAHEQLLAEAESLAREISQLAPLAIRACLEAVTRGTDLPLAEGLELESELFSQLFTTEDMREGTSAFLEKRAPEFKGK
jgi:enoyl-CoA hydratase